MNEKKVTVGFVARERFSHAAKSLQTIVENTRIPFNLIVVNNQIPKIFWDPVQEILNTLEHVKVIETEHFITANGAKNLVIKEAEDELICLIENDMEVAEGWLSHLIDAAEARSSEVTVPLIFEWIGTTDIVHFDERLGSIQKINGEDGPSWQINHRKRNVEKDRMETMKFVDFLEMHCILFRKPVFEKIGLLDEKLHGSRQEVDLSMALHRAGVNILFEPKSEVTFIQPPPVYPEESEFYAFIWDVDKAKEEEKQIQKKWKLVNFPGAVDFAVDRIRILEESDPDKQKNPFTDQIKADMEAQNLLFQETAKDLSNCISPGERLILVDDMKWEREKVAPGYRIRPFLEKDGVYWGSPENDDKAIHELGRMKAAGDHFIVFGQPAFWWLDYYSKFNQFLRSNFKIILENDRIVVFDLQT